MRASLLSAGVAGLALACWALAARSQFYPPAPASEPPPQADQPAPPHAYYQPYQDQPPDRRPPYSPPPSSPPGPVLQTPNDYGHSSVEHAVTAPLHDLNITGQRIPPVLLLAMADPYARLAWPSCEAIDAAIAELAAAMGPDFDEAKPVDTSIVAQARPTALALLHGAAENLLPYNSYISTLSGAQRHDALVIRALNAGAARRGYLKGLGEAHDCPPPAAPEHLYYVAPPVKEPMRPMYPIR